MVEEMAKLGVKAHRVGFKIRIKMLEPNHVKILNFKRSNYNGTFFNCKCNGIDYWFLTLVGLIDFKETKDKAKSFNTTNLNYARCQTSLILKLSLTRTQHTHNVVNNIGKTSRIQDNTPTNVWSWRIATCKLTILKESSTLYYIQLFHTICN
jgi:hypothetical protein